jgi:N-acetyl-anhydromuramyl-L-alanine amidase AmpD
MDEAKQDVTTDSLGPDLAALAVAREDSAIWQARTAYLQEQAQRSDESSAALQAQLLTLEAQIKALQAYAARLEVQLNESYALLDVAQSKAATLPHLASAIARPQINDVIDQLPRSTESGNEYARRGLDQIRYLVLHQTGVDPAITPQQLAQQHMSDPQRQWPGIGFHYVIAVDGTIYQTNRLETVCYHVIHQNAAAVGVALAGELNSQPSEAQLAGAAVLLAWLAQDLKLPAGSIVGHCELPGQDTDCPGAAWQTGNGWKETLLQRVTEAGQAAHRRIYHYVLFAQSGASLSEADWQAASRYIVRFLPTVGFSVQDASLAENVTIIGGLSGVPAPVEQMLRAAGCRVQRLTGKNAAQTRSLLDKMAREGQRFLATQSAPQGQQAGAGKP